MKYSVTVRAPQGFHSVYGDDVRRAFLELIDATDSDGKVASVKLTIEVEEEDAE